MVPCPLEKGSCSYWASPDRHLLMPGPHQAGGFWSSSLSDTMGPSPTTPLLWSQPLWFSEVKLPVDQTLLTTWAVVLPEALWAEKSKLIARACAHSCIRGPCVQVLHTQECLCGRDVPRNGC